MERVWSNHQEHIFNFCVAGQGNAIVEAVAGSGKTTTLVEAIRRILQVRSDVTVIFLAFNKSIAEELKSRGVNARTFHSLCYGVALRYAGGKVDPDKLRNIIRERLGELDQRLYGAFITKLVGLARQAGIGCLVPDEEAAWVTLIDHHDLELDNEQADPTRALTLARKLLRASNEHCDIDYDDMLYLTVKEGLVLPKFDFVFVDEAQDTNAIQRALLRKLMHPGSFPTTVYGDKGSAQLNALEGIKPAKVTRLIAVGDPAQAIYGFRGADSDSMNLIAEEFSCSRLPLTVSYRCPTAVVEHARQWVQHIEASPTAVAGSVETLGTAWKTTQFSAGDLVVCRTTKPVVALAYQLLRARIPAKVLGREIGQGLAKLIERMKAQGLERLVEKLNLYTAREVQKAIAKGQESKAESIQDKTDTVLFLIDSLPETTRTIPALLQVIESLFSGQSNTGAVTLATIHKAKGLEADHVYWLNSSKCPAKWARQEWQQQQERNLCYVATTRAHKTLTLIEESSTLEASK